MCNNSLVKNYKKLFKCANSVYETSKQIELIKEYVNNMRREVYESDSTQITEANLYEYIKKINLMEANKIEKITKKLQEYNWYLIEYSYGTMLKLWYILEITDDEDLENKINAFMVNLVLKNLESIYTNSFEKFKERKHIINEIFQGFFNKQYNLMIPTVLAQVDGISNDLLKEGFYGKVYKQNIPKTKGSIDEIINNKKLNEKEVASLLQLTYIRTILGKVEDKKILNRHNIIHGSSCLYGTELNAYKSIALLGFMTYLYEVINND